VSKLISVADDVYELLKARKRNRSFSEVLRDALGAGKQGKSLMEFAGAWKDIPDPEFRKMEKAMTEFRAGLKFRKPNA